MRFCLRLLPAALLLFAAFSQTGNAYDPLDPHGRIHIKWDVISWIPDGYVAAVTMTNHQMYRHIASPGWTMGWRWAKKEVIWSMLGAQAADQGDCSKFKGNLPHSCKRDPAIVDLLPGVPKNQKFTHCCKGGILASRGQDPGASVSSFQLTVGHSGTSNRTVSLPQDFYLVGHGPGYTCNAASIVSPSVFYSSDGRRRSQALMTWEVVCSYSQLIVSKNPSCCVSLSSFYNPDITPCPSCACGCQSETTCVKDDPKISSIVQSSASADGSMSKCTEHMCPVRIHWHVKTNYRDYWKVKLTITNLRYGMNYTQWNLVAQHPSLRKIANVSSFLYKPLMVYGPLNDTGMFYGMKDQNALLLEAGAEGNVQSEIILQKEDKSSFTLEHGWAFPLKIYFNGDECVMPSPDEYPFLPSSANFSFLAPGFYKLGSLLILVFVLLLV